MNTIATLAEHINKDYLQNLIAFTLAVASYCLWRYDDANILVPQTGRYTGWAAWYVTVALLLLYWYISQ